MKNLIDPLKKFQLKRVIAFLAVGFLLLVNTACSNPEPPQISSSDTTGVKK
ncbi:MAG: hypothetical protein F6K23_01780 [Okeania sp. SIO2C9]|uniref:DUF6658 family protein n=1 Tax=Okeania sp. SIO2C9 TaxID=2607791 RepID=UPI0013C127AA|nr:DUF6658 family protein [Okeania sp. SIO2C9]NEQ71918.1 hypothetical protein [Okeania sp. SIO2C9]